MLAAVWGKILAKDERGRLPGGQLRGQPLDELSQRHGSIQGTFRRQRAERIHDDDSRRQLFDLGNNRVQHSAQIVTEYLLSEVDEMNHVVHLGHVEEGELPLIAQHLERRLPQQREVDGRALC